MGADVTFLNNDVTEAANPHVTYTPFVKDGMVGYRAEHEDGRVGWLYFNPSNDTDDGTPNVFVYQSESPHDTRSPDPSWDGALYHFTLFQS